MNDPRITFEEAADAAEKFNLIMLGCGYWWGDYSHVPEPVSREENPENPGDGKNCQKTAKNPKRKIGRFWRNAHIRGAAIRMVRRVFPNNR